MYKVDSRPDESVNFPRFAERCASSFCKSPTEAMKCGSLGLDDETIDKSGLTYIVKYRALVIV